MKKLLLLLGLLITTPAFAAPNNLSTDVAPKDCSGTITLGGTAQNAFAGSHFTNGFYIENLDTSEPLYFNFTGVATLGTAPGSFAIGPGTATTFQNVGSVFFPVGFNTALSVNATTTAHKFSCMRW